MVVPKIQNAHDPATRNIINRAIEVLNQLGINVQDLVAEGQLTPAQYAELLKDVNGLISKGNVSVQDINKNLGKLDGTFFSSDFLKQLSDGELNTTNVLDGSITTSKVAEKAITPKETSFLVHDSKNIATDRYYNWGLVEVEGKWVIQGVTPAWNGRIQVVDVNPNTTYTVSNHDKSISNRFGIVISDNPPAFDENNYFYPDRIIKTDTLMNTTTFTTDSSTGYLYVYPSNQGNEPRIQVEEGSAETDYVSPYVLTKDFMLTGLNDEFIKKETSVTVIETETGYPERPDVPSVIWIGKNEPTEAQPYDEWRETGGYIYYEDFSEDEVGSFPSKWSKKWVASGEIETRESALSPSGSNVLQWTGSLARSAIDFSKVSEDQNREDSEVYFVSRDNSIGSSMMTSAVLRGSGGSGSETGYVIGPRPTATTGNDSKGFNISKYYNGELSTLGTFSSTVDFTEYHCIRARIDGNVIKGKVWQYGEIEPDWQIEVTDPVSLPSGFVGIFKFLRNHSYIDTVGIGTGGMRAPTKKVF